MRTPTDPKSFLRGCTNRDVKDLVARLIALDLKSRVTKSGIIFYGPTGTVGAHRTQSDRRALQNMRRDIRKAGIHLPD